jgi:hypothetical protein
MEIDMIIVGLNTPTAMIRWRLCARNMALSGNLQFSTIEAEGAMNAEKKSLKTVES